MIVTLALALTLSPGERNSNRACWKFCWPRLQSPPFCSSFEIASNHGTRSQCMRLESDSPSPGGEGPGEGGRSTISYGARMWSQTQPQRVGNA